MKKQVAAVVSFSALLTLSAFAPKVFWQEKVDVGRFPASEEAITPPKKSLYEMREMDKHLSQKIEDKKEEAQVSCVKDKQTALEDEIKKLMADKEAIMKEIDDLKKSKKEEPLEEKEEKKVSKKKEEKEDFVSLVSQMTSLMISQQQQQTMLMQQMFTMMNQMQQPQQNRMQQNLMNPYAFDMNMSFDQMYPQALPSSMPMSEFGSAFGQLGQQVGISYQSPSQQQSQSYMNPYAMQVGGQQQHEQLRAPSNQSDFAFPQVSNTNIQAAVQQQMPVGNMSMFNPIFGGMTESATNWQDMQRVQF